MASNYVEWQLNLFDMRLNRPIADSTGLFTVITAGTPTVATAYSDAQGTALTLPATMNNGACRFFLDSSVTTVDFVCVTANGHSKYLRGVTPSNQRILIDPEQISHRMYVPFLTALSAAVTNAGFTLSTNMLVRGAYARCSAVGSATGLLSCGTTTGSVTGFFNALILTVTGWLNLIEVSISNGFAGNLLLGQTTVTNQWTRAFHRPANATSGISIIYQTDVTNTTGAAGFIVLEYDRLVAP